MEAQVARVTVGDGAKEGECRARRRTHEEEIEIRIGFRGKIGDEGEGTREG